jgi:hypothetical protein
LKNLGLRRLALGLNLINLLITYIIIFYINSSELNTD